MNKSILVLFSCLLIIFASCSRLINKFNPDLNIGRKWLNNNAGIASVNIDGAWEDVAYRNWGNLVFIQNSNSIIGTITDYDVEAVMNGKRVYMILINDNHVYYTMIFDCSSNVMIGKYTSGFTGDYFNGTKVNFRRSLQ